MEQALVGFREKNLFRLSRLAWLPARWPAAAAAFSPLRISATSSACQGGVRASIVRYIRYLTYSAITSKREESVTHIFSDRSYSRIS